MMKKASVMLFEPRKQSSQLMRRRIAIACFILLALFQLHSYHRASQSVGRYSNEDEDLLAATPQEHARRGNIDRLHRLAWAKLASTLEANKPSTATSLRVTGHVPLVSLRSTHRLDEFDVVPLDSRTIFGLSIAHFRFVKENRYRFDSSVYLEGKRGIVMTASGDDLPAALIQLKLLRRTRSKLPVDIFLPGMDDYDAEICETLMRSLNARCRVLQKLMDDSNTHEEALQPTEVQRMMRSRTIVANEPLHKLLALFFSDWEENLMLGFDTLVYNSPDAMFGEEPYLSHGLVMWPDQWTSSISPKMDLIQRKRIPNTESDKSATVDMGQLVLSKSMQRKTLLLAIYYTFFGPNLYDVLLRQSMGGEAGSQAIKAAARYFDAPFFVLRRDVEAVGFAHLKEKKKAAGLASASSFASASVSASASSIHQTLQFQAVATLQHFALEDYHRQPHEQHRPAFIRANRPVLNPLTIMHSSVMADLQRSPNNVQRMWQTFSARHESNGWQDSDPENALWAEMETLTCHQLTAIPQYADRSAQACRDIVAHRSKL